MITCSSTSLFCPQAELKNAQIAKLEQDAIAEAGRAGTSSTSVEDDIWTHGQAVFEKFDKDFSGYIDAHELRDMMIELGVEFSERQLIELYQTMEDTKNGKIELKSFVKWLSRKHEPSHSYGNSQHSGRRSVALPTDPSDVSLKEHFARQEHVVVGSP